MSNPSISIPTFNFNQQNSSILSTSLDPDSVFSCNICLDSLKDKEPVVTQCGHLYCWPCLYRWLITRRSSADSTCPVCKAGVTQENVIPIFIRSEEEERNHKEKKKKKKASSNEPVAAPSLSPSGNVEDEEEEEEEEDSIPSRPQAHRPDPAQLATVSANSINNLNYGGSSFQPTVGYFPSLFGLQFHSFLPSPPSNSTSTSSNQTNPNDFNEMDRKEKAYLSRILYVLLFSVFLCLLLF